MKDAVSVLLGIPSNGDWKADFGMSLAGLVAYSAMPLKDGRKIQQLRLFNSKGSILPRGRTTLVKQALEMQASHILFLDSDMVFPVQTLHRLLSWDKAVVGCNCPTKMLPSTPTARVEGGPVGTPLYSLPDDIGIKRVWRVGTGVMLIKTSVFLDIPQPWFPIEWVEELGDYRGEDWAFCERLDKAGIPIYVDLGLSRVIGHVGDLRYEHKHVEIPNGI